MTDKYWLLKAEPDSRVVKGKDVKFSVDDFEAVKTSPWEGVRNYEARNLMKEMKTGEKALFYHSNCKNPGVAGFAKVSKEAYPDYTAWDPSHPYFDAKSNKDDPRWFMVDLTFDSRAMHFIPLSLLRYIADSSSLPKEVEYIGEEGFQALKTMDLVRRGRLSVQRVEPMAWQAITLMASKGGWDDLDLKPTKKPRPALKRTTAPGRSATRRKVAKGKKKEEKEEEPEITTATEKVGRSTRGKRKMVETEEEEEEMSALSELSEDGKEKPRRRGARNVAGKKSPKKGDEDEESYQDSGEEEGNKGRGRGGRKRKAGGNDEDGEYKSPVRHKRKR